MSQTETKSSSTSENAAPSWRTEFSSSLETLFLASANVTNTCGAHRAAPLPRSSRSEFFLQAWGPQNRPSREHGAGFAASDTVGRVLSGNPPGGVHLGRVLSPALFTPVTGLPPHPLLQHLHRCGGTTTRPATDVKKSNV